MRCLQYKTPEVSSTDQMCFFEQQPFSRKCLSKQTPLSPERLRLSWSLTAESPELKKQGAYQVNVPRYVESFCNVFKLRFLLHILTRFSSYLPQRSQVSHLCQWSLVHVGKKPFILKPDQRTKD